MPEDLWERARRKDAATRGRRPIHDDSSDSKTLNRIAEGVRLKLHRPGPQTKSKRVYAIYEDIVFDDDLIAKMMANLAAHGLTLEDLWPTQTQR